MLAQKPWSEPKHRLANESEVAQLTNLIASPRFKAASDRYGIKDPRSLLPAVASSSSSAVEASFYGRQERRRLADLRAVLVERSMLIERDVQRSATEPVLPRDPIANFTQPVSPPSKEAASLASQHHQYIISTAKRRTKMELLKLIEDETQQRVYANADREHRERLAIEEKQKRVESDLRRKERHKEFRSRRDAWEQKTLCELERQTTGMRERQRQEQAHREAKRESMQKLQKQEAVRREHERTNTLKDIRSRSAAQFAAYTQNIDDYRKRKDAQYAKWCQEKQGSQQQRGKIVPLMEGEAGDLVRQMKLKSEQKHDAFRSQVEAKLKAEEQRVAAVQQHRSVAMDEKRRCQSTRFRDAERRRHQVN